MPRDVDLQLETGRTVIATVNGEPILTEGGKFALVSARFGAFSGASTTVDVVVQASRDGGANYFEIGRLPQLGPTTDDDIGTKRVTRPVYVPRPETPGTAVRVRLRYVAAGSSPSYVVEDAWLEPLLSLAPHDADEKTLSGLAFLA